MVWKKGQSGNPSGKPPQPVEVRMLARTHTAEAINTLSALMRKADAPESARVRAAEALLNRAWGTPESTATVKVERNDVRDLSRAEILELLAAQGVVRQDRGTDEHGAVH